MGQTDLDILKRLAYPKYSDKVFTSKGDLFWPGGGALFDFWDAFLLKNCDPGDPVWKYWVKWIQSVEEDPDAEGQSCLLFDVEAQIMEQCPVNGPLEGFDFVADNPLKTKNFYPSKSDSSRFKTAWVYLCSPFKPLYGMKVGKNDRLMLRKFIESSNEWLQIKALDWENKRPLCSAVCKPKTEDMDSIDRRSARNSFKKLANHGIFYGLEYSTSSMDSLLKDPIYWQRFHETWAALTPLGKKFVSRFSREILTGQRVRWTQTDKAEWHP